MPARRRVLAPQSVFDIAALEALVDAHACSRIHVRKIYKALVDTVGITSFDAIPDLPRRLRAALNRDFVITSTRVQAFQPTSGGGGKLVVALSDGRLVETVLIKHGHGGVADDMASAFADHDRCRDGDSDGTGGPGPSVQKLTHGHMTVCISSQVGCAMGCTFCATGTMGLMADLTCGEILEQMFHATVYARQAGIMHVRNCTMMGMGEPLDNYAHVLNALRGMNVIFNVGYPHITVSTVGVVDKIRRLAVDCPRVRLALSLHAPTQETRIRIVPSAKHYTMEALMDACEFYTNVSCVTCSKCMHE